MPDTSLPSILDALAIRVKTLTGIKECYTVTGSEADTDGTLMPIPPSIDSTPVANLWALNGDVSAGNTELELSQIELGIWERATGAGYGYTILMAYPDRVKELLRTDLDLGGRATRLLYKGWSQVRPQELDNGQTFLYLPIRLELLRAYFSSDYAV